MSEHTHDENSEVELSLDVVCAAMLDVTESLTAALAALLEQFEEEPRDEEKAVLLELIVNLSAKIKLTAEFVNAYCGNGENGDGENGEDGNGENGEGEM